MPSFASAGEARSVVESLRFGIPPSGHVAEFTVGRELELQALAATLDTRATAHGSALLIKANYGSGKSHLLQVVRERALATNHAVALVTCDAQNGVRFNRMDTIFGAITRGIAVPGGTVLGVGSLFAAFAQATSRGLADVKLTSELTAAGRWAPASSLCAPMLVGLRAWVLGGTAQQRLVEEWFAWPESYRSRRKDLYWELIANLEGRFRDDRSERQLYAQDVFWFHTGGHRNAWLGIRDLDLIAKAAGLQGLVLLIDEFEDVITNLRNSAYQVAAFTNLFEFFEGTRDDCMTYFAVTPEFAERCRAELTSRGVYHLTTKEFARLPAFELSQIGLTEFRELALRIAECHGLAYRWQPPVGSQLWSSLVKDAWGTPSPDRIRRAVQALVDRLDQVRTRGAVA